MAKKCGLSNSQIIIDPGLGFGKRVDDNFLLINNIEKFKRFNVPLMIGLSRKSFLGDLEPNQKLINTLIANTYACTKGVDILRVHDVEEHLTLKDMLAKF